jgi:hypothetical protein
MCAPAGAVMSPVIKTCTNCGIKHTAGTWRVLRYLGDMDDGAGGKLVLKNCVCRTTLAIEVAATTEAA